MRVLGEWKIHLFIFKVYTGLINRCFTFSLSSLFYQPADEYEFSGIVYSHHMSPVATTHCLVAVGCHSSTLKLVDLKSGSATHMLKGHKKSILTVRWSPKNEYLLVSGRFVEISYFPSNVLLLTVMYPVCGLHFELVFQFCFYFCPILILPLYLLIKYFIVFSLLLQSCV